MAISKWRGPTMVLAAAVTLFAAGCGSSTSSNNAGPITGVPTLPKVSGLEKTSLNVAVVPAMDSAGFFIAQQEGLFNQEGLTVHYSPATSSEAVISDQVNGKYDITGGNYVSYIQAEMAGSANLQIIAEGSVMQQGAQVILTLPKYNITSLQGLEGHYLAVNTTVDPKRHQGNIDFLLAASTLSNEGIPIDRVNWTTVPFPDMLNALNQGSYTDPSTGRTVPVQAVVVPEPFSSVISEHLGAVTLADLNQGATTEFPIEGYVTTSSWAQANPNTLKAFLLALRAGQQIADTNRAAVESAFESLPGMMEGQVPKTIGAIMALDQYPLTVDEIRLQRVVDVMQQFGLLSDQFRIKTMLG